MKWLNRIRSSFADALSVEEKGLFWLTTRATSAGSEDDQGSNLVLVSYMSGSYGTLGPVVFLRFDKDEFWTRQYIQNLKDPIGDGKMRPPRRPEFNLPKNWIFV